MTYNEPLAANNNLKLVSSIYRDFSFVICTYNCLSLLVNLGCSWYFNRFCPLNWPRLIYLNMDTHMLNMWSTGIMLKFCQTKNCIYDDWFVLPVCTTVWIFFTCMSVWWPLMFTSIDDELKSWCPRHRKAVKMSRVPPYYFLMWN